MPNALSAALQFLRKRTECDCIRVLAIETVQVLHQTCLYHSLLVPQFWLSLIESMHISVLVHKALWLFLDFRTTRKTNWTICLHTLFMQMPCHLPGTSVGMVIFVGPSMMCPPRMDGGIVFRTTFFSNVVTVSSLPVGEVIIIIRISHHEIIRISHTKVQYSLDNSVQYSTVQPSVRTVHSYSCNAVCNTHKPHEAPIKHTHNTHHPHTIVHII